MEHASPGKHRVETRLHSQPESSQAVSEASDSWKATLLWVESRGTPSAMPWDVAKSLVLCTKTWPMVSLLSSSSSFTRLLHIFPLALHSYIIGPSAMKTKDAWPTQTTDKPSHHLGSVPSGPAAIGYSHRAL